MGGFDFTWNAIQSGQIRELEERIEKLEEQNQILYEWVQYFKHYIGDIDDGRIPADDSGRTQSLPETDP